MKVASTLPNMAHMAINSEDEDNFQKCSESEMHCCPELLLFVTWNPLNERRLHFYNLKKIPLQDFNSGCPKQREQPGKHSQSIGWPTPAPFNLLAAPSEMVNHGCWDVKSIAIHGQRTLLFFFRANTVYGKKDKVYLIQKTVIPKDTCFFKG